MPFRADMWMLTLKKRSQLFWNSVANGLLAKTTTARKGEQMIQLTFWAPRQLYVKLMFMGQGEWMPIYRNGNKSASHLETFSNFQLSPPCGSVERFWQRDTVAGLFCCRVGFVQLFVQAKVKILPIKNKLFHCEMENHHKLLPLERNLFKQFLKKAKKIEAFYRLLYSLPYIYLTRIMVSKGTCHKTSTRA